MQINYRILFFGGFSSPPRLYKNLTDFFNNQGLYHDFGSVGESSIKVEFVDWMNEKEGEVAFDSNLQNMIIVCHSMGCQAGLNFYNHYKNKIRSIVLFDYHPFDHPFADPPQKGLGQSFFPEGAYNSTEIIKEVISVMKPDKFAYFTKKFANQKIVPIVPTLLVMSTELQHIDNKLVYTCIDPKKPYIPIQLSKLINYMAIPKANHFWFMENKLEYSEYISEIWKWIVVAVSKS